ncbi:MAG: uncharacterized protein KVP18_003935 [Porospora cf. gigantea A]|uniref:uncharacterized protein n=1 Tax=Porospora cf. gigantea A TaxID=2853593 RepID=UPI00355991B8|nr:MAG: hypothetical protein KVP18_003935 [Porospora cf. gigantea A]
MISGFTKVFVAQYLNSAIIALLVHFKWQTRPRYLGNVRMTGNYADLSPKWYLDVGHYYMIVSLTYIVFPHILRLMKLPVHHYLRRWRTSKFEQGIQADLDKIWTPPEFKLDVKYANIMSIVFLVFTYYSGVPVMLFFVCCTVLIVYWCDKTEFLRGAARPPFYDETLSNTAVVSPSDFIANHNVSRA